MREREREARNLTYTREHAQYLLPPQAPYFKIYNQYNNAYESNLTLISALQKDQTFNELIEVCGSSDQAKQRERAHSRPRTISHVGVAFAVLLASSSLSLSWR